MREMKDSGVEWIGEIPKDWDYFRIKYNFYLKGRIGWQGLKAEEFIDVGPYLITGTDFQNGRVNWETCYHISDERYIEAPEIHVTNDDLLITKDGTVGKVAYIEAVPDKASLNSHILLIRSKVDLVVNKYLFWVLQSPMFDTYNGLTQNGTIMASLSQEKISNFSFVIPELHQQHRIADYLDAKCAQIDRAIARQQEVIEKLKEYKLSVITEAVTKGLNPDVPMKDSGIEWIGEIPEGWDTVAFGRVAQVKSNLVDPSRYPDLPQISPESIEKDSGRLLSYSSVDESGVFSFNHYFYTGQILYSKIRPKLNKACIAPFEGLCSADMYPIKTNADTRFILYCIISYSFLSQVIMVTESRVKMPKINQSELARIMIALPPEKQAQEQIAEYLDRFCEKLDLVLGRKKVLIDKLTEYKKSLIYEVVTGKREV